MRRITITLGGTEYSVPLLNLDQLEEVSEVTAQYSGGKQAIMVLRIAMRRAEPKVENVGDIQATPQEVGEALRVILDASGMKGENPPAAAPAA